MLPLSQPEPHALLDWSEFNSLTLAAYIPEGEKWDKLIPWIDDGCVGQPDLCISVDDLDKEGVSTLIHADMVPYLQFIRDKGVLDDSAWAALQVGMQAGMAAIAGQLMPCICIIVWLIRCCSRNTLCHDASERHFKCLDCASLLYVRPDS